MSTHLDDRSNPGDGPEADIVGPIGTVGPVGADADSRAERAGWDHAPADLLRSPMPTQSALSRLGDVLVSPFGRRRRETMVLLSLVILALLVWVAVTELLVAPGASQSILS